MRRSHLFAVSLVAAAIVSGVSFAGAAGVTQGVQVVTACVHAGNSQLRLTSDSGGCGADDALTWNATLNSISASQVGDVLATRGQGFQTVEGGSESRLASLTLPPGSYLLSAKVVVVRGGSSTGGSTGVSVDCVLSTSANPDRDFAFGNFVDFSSAAAAGATIPLEAAVSFTSQTSVHLACADDDFGTSILLSNEVLAALVVGHVNG